MRLSLPILAVIALFAWWHVLPSSVQAQDKVGDEDLCANSATEAALLVCRRDAQVAMERELKTLYEQLLADYEDEPELAKLLKDSQDIWARLRLADCAVETFYSRGGSAYEVYELDCLNKLGDLRLQYLKALSDAP